MRNDSNSIAKEGSRKTENRKWMSTSFAVSETQVILSNAMVNGFAMTSRKAFVFVFSCFLTT